MTIFQLTDLHIAREGADSSGIDVRGNFLRGLERAVELRPDAVVVSGDLCMDVGDAEIYDWVFAQLRGLPMPFFTIPGNHDDSAMMAQHIDYQRVSSFFEGCFAAQVAGHRLIFLNSERGFLTDEKLAWLDARLAETDLLALVFIHYPPLLTGAKFMDTNYPMAVEWRRGFQKCVFRHPAPVSVFCGHYHAARTVCLKNMTVHVAPSTYFQIDPLVETFAIDHYRPGFRWIALEGERVQSSVHYFEGQFLAQPEFEK